MNKGMWNRGPGSRRVAAARKSQRRGLACESLERRLVLSHTNPNAIPTVGVYDENVDDSNAVDYVATGSGLTNTEFADRVATAFARDQGGVINGTRLGGYYAFGATTRRCSHSSRSGARTGESGTGITSRGRAASPPPTRRL